MTKIFTIEAEPFAICPAIGKVIRRTRPDGKDVDTTGLVCLEPAEFLHETDGHACGYCQWDTLYPDLFCVYNGVLFYVTSNDVSIATIKDVPHNLIKRFFTGQEMVPEEIYKRLRAKGVRIFLSPDGDTVMLVDNKLVYVGCEEAYKALEKNGYLNEDGTLRKDWISKDVLTEDNVEYILNLHRYAR